MEPEIEIEIVKVVRTTAKNMYDMLNQLANHIEALEMENQMLREKVKDDAQ